MSFRGPFSHIADLEGEGEEEREREFFQPTLQNALTFPYGEVFERRERRGCDAGLLVCFQGKAQPTAHLLILSKYSLIGYLQRMHQCSQNMNNLKYKLQVVRSNGNQSEVRIELLEPNNYVTPVTQKFKTCKYIPKRNTCICTTEILFKNIFQQHVQYRKNLL